MRRKDVYGYANAPRSVTVVRAAYVWAAATYSAGGRSDALTTKGFEIVKN
jgi:hypothetical protein